MIVWDATPPALEFLRLCSHYTEYMSWGGRLCEARREIRSEPAYHFFSSLTLSFFFSIFSAFSSLFVPHMYFISTLLLLNFLLLLLLHFLSIFLLVLLFFLHIILSSSLTSFHFPFLLLPLLLFHRLLSSVTDSLKVGAYWYIVNIYRGAFPNDSIIFPRCACCCDNNVMSVMMKIKKRPITVFPVKKYVKTQIKALWKD